MRRWTVWLLALIGLGGWSATGFKAEDFKKCDMAAFCKRLRGTRGDVYAVDAASVEVQGPVLSALLRNTACGAQFSLQLTAYGVSTVRLHIDELPGKSRFEVPLVLMPELEQQREPWQGEQRAAGSVSLQLGPAQVQLQYSPLQLTVSLEGKPAIEFNSQQLFNFEQLRQKQDGDPEGWWEETFKSHHDSKPAGPEAISMDISFPGSKHLYGLPEHATDLSLKPTVGPEGPISEPYRMYNLDVFEYDTDSPFGLYGSIPLLISHQPGLTVGAFWLNAAEMLVDVSRDGRGMHSNWLAESGVVDLFLFLGPTAPKVMQQYSFVTGTTALPQYFAIGYHQCRWNYRDEADVKAVDATFDQHDIPYDVIWLDIEHTDGKRYFTWDKNFFPDPAAMQEHLAAKGRKLVTIIDPHVKRDDNYYIFKEAQRQGFFVNNKDGKEYDGWCWPGASSYLDMLNPAARDWWAAQYALNRYKGSTRHLYAWNDMNEPSVFNGPEITMPKDNLHHGGVEHRDLHNLNGLLFHMANAQGLAERGRALAGSDGDRPFVLSRSFFAGTQRVGAIWTGDNAATWEHLRASIPMLLTIGLSGLTFSGADVGGFFGNPDDELLVRWNQVAAYTPFFRGHAHLEAKRREPWLFGEDNTRRNRDAIRARYALLPYLYTQFWAAHTAGEPVMRPLWYAFPDQEATFGVQREFMLGPAVLVSPVIEQGAASQEVHLPTGARWFDAHTGAEVPRQAGWLTGEKPVHKVDVDMESIPVFLRGGSVVPRRERSRRSTLQMASDPFTLWVVLDDQGAAEGDLYLDDGRSFAFQRGIFAHRRFSFRDGRLTASAAPAAATAAVAPYRAGKYQPALVIERVVVLGLPGGPEGWSAAVTSPASRELEAAPGPLQLRPELAGTAPALVVRKPDLPAAGDWTLQLTRA